MLLLERKKKKTFEARRRLLYSGIDSAKLGNSKNSGALTHVLKELIKGEVPRNGLVGNCTIQLYYFENTILKSIFCSVTLPLGRTKFDVASIIVTLLNMSKRFQDVHRYSEEQG